MKEIASYRAQNGRSGIVVVSKHDIENVFDTPYNGRFLPVGVIDRRNVYELVIDATSNDYVIIIGGDSAKTIAGCVRVTHQGRRGEGLGLYRGGAFFAIEKWRMRNSTLLVFSDGKELKVPPSVLLAMGLLPSQGELLNEELNKPIPAVNNAVLSALKAAGL